MLIRTVDTSSALTFSASGATILQEVSQRISVAVLPELAVVQGSTQGSAQSSRTLARLQAACEC